MIIFTFFDTGGNKYNLKTIKKDFSANYPFPYNPNIILVEANSITNSKYILQERASKSFDFESYATIYITAFPNYECTDRYHLKKAEAQRLNPKTLPFRITLINTNHEIIISTTNVIKGFRKYFKKYSKDQ
jgi:hypothetical protein